LKLENVVIVSKFGSKDSEDAAKDVAKKLLEKKVQYTLFHQLMWKEQFKWKLLKK
jgi:hypothetical protein